MRLIRSNELIWSEVPGVGAGAQVADVTGPELCEGMATGFVRFEAGAKVTRPLAYDEVVHVLSGSMRIEMDGSVEVGGAGDVFFLPKGSTPACEWPEASHIFFVVHPANWREVIEAPS